MVFLLGNFQDKWRNLSVSNGSQGSKEKSRVPKIKAPASGTPVVGNAVATTVQNATSATPVTHQAEPSAVAVRDPSQNDDDAKNPPRYVNLDGQFYMALSLMGGFCVELF